MALDRDQIQARLDEQDGQRDLSGLDMSGADLTGLSLAGVDLSRADLSGANLSRVDLRGANMSRADLSSADLRWAILEGADLQSSILRAADARWAIFSEANLRQADLTKTNMGWSDIAGAQLTGAQMDGTILENVNLSDAATERGVSARQWTITGVPSELQLPRLGNATIAAAAVGIVALVHIWGWLYGRSYFGAFEVLDQPGVVGIGHADNVVVGLGKVITLLVKALILSPLVLIAAVVVVGLAGALAYALVLAGEKLIDRAAITQPAARPLLVAAIFVIYTLIFWLLVPPATAWARDRWKGGLPEEGGTVRSLYDLFVVGGLPVKLGAVACVAVAGAFLWFVWRWLGIFLSDYELPVELRLKYPSLNSALVAARESRVFARTEPLTEKERRRALYAAVGGVILLGTVLSAVGRVYAFYDMCDGGELPRVQLYTNRQPESPPPDSEICQRLLAETETNRYVFFPSQTEASGHLATRRAHVAAVANERIVHEVVGAGEWHACPTCLDGPSGLERLLIDPDEIQVRGVIVERSGDLLLLDVEADEPYGTVRMSPGQTEVFSAEGMLQQDWQVLQPGVEIVATGYPSVDQTMLDARRVQMVESAAPADLEPPVLLSDLTDPEIILISGSNWIAGNTVKIGPGDLGETIPKWPLLDVTVGPDGTFDAPLEFDSGMPTGPEIELIAWDAASQQSARAPWILEPPPTPTTAPTRPRPTSPLEISPSPAEPAEGTAPPEALATNTPFPTTGWPGAPGIGVGCTTDDYEPDWPRGREKEIYVSFSETAVTQSHTFCGTGGDRGKDVDLAFFDVKKGRWYKVFTTNLAPGVDTVMAVGDLPNSTACQPAGCWNDDRAALTYESQIVFQAVEMGRGLITVDNRGSNYGDEATYELGVVEFIPTPTPTPSPAPSATASVTPTRTPTPVPLFDRCEDNDSCRYANTSCVLYPGQPAYKNTTIYPGSDEDWFLTDELEPGYYELHMRPPPGEDYDLELRYIERQSTNLCPLVPFVNQGWTAGDAKEMIAFEVLEPTVLVARVYTPYPTVYGNPNRAFELWLERTGDAPTLTPSATPTASATWTPAPSASPTATVSATASVSATLTVTSTSTSAVTPPGPGTPSATASRTPTNAVATPTVTAAPTASVSPTTAATTVMERRRRPGDTYHR